MSLHLPSFSTSAVWASWMWQVPGLRRIAWRWWLGPRQGGSERQHCPCSKWRSNHQVGILDIRTGGNQPYTNSAIKRKEIRVLVNDYSVNEALLTDTLNSEKAHEGCNSFSRWISPSKHLTCIPCSVPSASGLNHHTALSISIVLSAIGPMSESDRCFPLWEAEGLDCPASSGCCTQRMRRTAMAWGFARRSSAWTTLLWIEMWQGITVPRVYDC